MTESETIALIEAVRAKAKKGGGWGAGWAARIGLNRAQVDQWMTRRAIPKGWRVALQASLKPNKRV